MPKIKAAGAAFFCSWGIKVFSFKIDLSRNGHL